MPVKVDKVQSSDVGEIRIDAEVSALGSRYGRAILARVRDFATLVSLKRILSDVGVVEVSLQYVGGFNMLLVFENDCLVGDFLSRDKDWKVWFSHADVWTGQVFAFERVAWVHVFGVPLHLFCDKVISAICSRFGSVVKFPQVTEDEGDLSSVCVGVLVGDGKRISEEVVLNWQDKRYRVWVSKELGDWVPECLVEDEDSVSSDDVVSIFGTGVMSSELN
ncbi:hypothetical protein HanHA300_Chr01g0013321 [Helianthus annuus]|nr:hypothetical protein HanHA300_Chr01g0013321 [Helianthus annuus]